VKKTQFALGAVLLAAAVIGCDTGPECAEGHYETRVRTKTVYVNKKPVTTPETYTLFVCDTYKEDQ
jgi:hypothetical protein